MKILSLILALLLAAAVSTGCDSGERGAERPSGSAVEQESEEEAAQGAGDAGTASGEPLPPEQWAQYDAVLFDLRETRALYKNWEGGQPQWDPDDPEIYFMQYDVTSIAEEDGTITLTVLHRTEKGVRIDVAWQDYTEEIPVWEAGTLEPRLFPAGESLVRLRRGAEGFVPISCAYTPYEGDDTVEAYLRGMTERLEPELSQSPKLNVAEHDPNLVEFIWHRLSATRYIAAPEDITLYDLEHYRYPLTIYRHHVDGGSEDPDFRLNGSLLALMTGLEELELYVPLEDCGVFRGHNNLRNLVLYNVDDAAMATLEIGGARDLHLRDIEAEVVDLSGCAVEALHISSWSEAVEDFVSCGGVKRLYIMSTRTDMTLVNADNFPGAAYLNLYFYSEMPRVRDFSGLPTFGADVVIDVQLDYRACNDETVRSLRGAKLREVVLTPENGPDPLDFDTALAELLDAETVTFDAAPGFQERMN